MNENTKDSRKPWRVVKDAEGFWQVWTAYDPAPGSRNNYVIADGIQNEDEAKLLASASDLADALKAMVELEATWDLMAGPDGTKRKWSIDANTRRQQSRTMAREALKKSGEAV